ncbi:MAG: hypothetical protein ACYCT9_13505 [Leptospirillum sp.]
MSRDMVCLECPLPDCLPQDPSCLLKTEKPEGEIREEDIPLLVGLRIVARKLGVAYETVRYRIKMRQWDALPPLFRTAPGGDWKCDPEDLEEFRKKMRGGAA